MKRIWLILLLTIIILTGCKNENRTLNEDFLWPASSVAEADSIFIQWLKLQYEIDGMNKSKVLLHKMRRLAQYSAPTGRLKARLAFMECAGMPDDCARTKLDSAVSCIDSSKLPYEYHKLKTLQTKFINDYMIKHIGITDELEYFSAIGDSLTMAFLWQQMATIWKNLGDNDTALKYYTDAESVWKNRRFTNFVLHNRLNIANTSLPSVRDSLYYLLRHDKTLEADTSFRELVFRNSFLIDGSLSHITTAASLADAYSKESSTRALNYALISQHYIEEGMADSALKYTRKAIARLDTSAITSDNRLVTGLASEAYNLCENFDSANYWMRVYVSWGDTLQMRLQTPNVMKMQARRNIEILRSSHAHEARIRNFVFLLLAALICCAFTVIISFIYVRSKKRELKEKRMKMNLELSTIRLRSAKAIFEARHKPFEKLKSKLTEMEKSGSVSSETAYAIKAALRENIEGAVEDASFFEINVQTAPEFAVRLKHDFPDLTEKQLDLSCYIASGMSSHQIARVLSISVASVNKARYRLRTRLGLKKEQDLEGFLRSYNSDKSDHET